MDLYLGMANFPPDPAQVLTWAGAFLRVVRQGLRDMEETEHDRVLLGFFSVVVFGRAVTNALQNLRTFDERAFDEWYEPWQREMRNDPLLRWFYKLRTDILKGITPPIAIVIGSSGRNAVRPGTVTVEDRPPPDVHRGESIQDYLTIDLCRLYVTYLEEMVESAAVVIWQVHDHHVASKPLPPTPTGPWVLGCQLPGRGRCNRGLGRNDPVPLNP
jgi:hypothetical protein